jgi:hypothetical protein
MVSSNPSSFDRPDKSIYYEAVHCAPCLFVPIIPKKKESFPVNLLLKIGNTGFQHIDLSNSMSKSLTLKIVGEDLKGSTHFWLLLLYFSTNMEDYL